MKVQTELKEYLLVNELLVKAFPGKELELGGDKASRSFGLRPSAAFIDLNSFFSLATNLQE